MPKHPQKKGSNVMDANVQELQVSELQSSISVNLESVNLESVNLTDKDKSMDKSTFVCGECSKEWNRDTNGLVPDFCVEHPDYYGFYVPLPKDKCYHETLGCPDCHDGNWQWRDIGIQKDINTQKDLNTQKIS